MRIQRVWQIKKRETGGVYLGFYVVKRSCGKLHQIVFQIFVYRGRNASKLSDVCQKKRSDIAVIRSVFYHRVEIFNLQIAAYHGAEIIFAVQNRNQNGGFVNRLNARIFRIFADNSRNLLLSVDFCLVITARKIIAVFVQILNCTTCTAVAALKSINPAPVRF